MTDEGQAKVIDEGQPREYSPQDGVSGTDENCWTGPPREDKKVPTRGAGQSVFSPGQVTVHSPPRPECIPRYGDDTPFNVSWIFCPMGEHRRGAQARFRGHRQG